MASTPKTTLWDSVETAARALDNLLLIEYALAGYPYGETEADFRRWCDELDRFIDETEGNLE